MWNPANQARPETASVPATPIKTDKPAKETLAATTAEPTPVSAPRNAVLNSAEQASIGKSLVIKGEVIGAESLYIEGRVEGTINLSGGATRVTVGKSGTVIADLSAREIVIMGKVTGNLVASDRLDIRSEGWLSGDVTTHRISIEDGAFFKGSVAIQKSVQGVLTGTDGKPGRR